MFELTPFNRKDRYLTGFNPFSELEQIERNFFNRNTFSGFKTDIKDIGNAYILEADLPGFEKQDIKVDVDNGYVTISAERHMEKEEKDNQGNYIRCERSYGSVSRSFDISDVKIQDITAAYENGVLKLTMPKLEDTQPTSRRLDIQ